MSLTELLTSIANAIRNKKGTADLIPAQNFANEINNLSSHISFNVSPTGSGATISFDIASNYSDYTQLTIDNIVAMPLGGVQYSSTASDQEFTWAYDSATGALSLTISSGRFSANTKKYAWRIAII